MVPDSLRPRVYVAAKGDHAALLSAEPRLPNEGNLPLAVRALATDRACPEVGDRHECFCSDDVRSATDTQLRGRALAPSRFARNRIKPPDLTVNATLHDIAPSLKLIREGPAVPARVVERHELDEMGDRV